MKKKNIAELAEKAHKLGKEYEKTYRGCGQCVIAALQDTLDARNDDIFKAATGLAGGTGLTGDSGCGAYIGAILVLSSFLGRERNNFSDPEDIRFRMHHLFQHPEANHHHGHTGHHAHNRHMFAPKGICRRHEFINRDGYHDASNGCENKTN